VELRKLAFVIQQLEGYSGVKKKINDASTFVCCPYHSENTPSFRIFHSAATKSPGWGKCYGCSASVNWNEHAPKLGLLPYEYAKPTEQFAVSTDLQLDSEPEEENLTLSDLPRDKIWRGMKTNFLIDVGCRKAVTEWGAVFVYMPVHISGELRGYIKARLRKETGKPSYINRKGAWSSDFGLFPYDYAVRDHPKVISLVEGPRDSLRFNSLGIPALAVLGTQSWSERKSRLVALTGAEHAIVAMDGDCAGIAAEELICKPLSRMMNVHIFSLHGDDSPYHQFIDEPKPSKAAKAAGVTLWDPGNCPQRKIRELKALIRSLSQD